MSTLGRDDAAQVARLARLVIDEEELGRYALQLAAVLDYAAQMTALDTSGVAPTAHPFPLRNVLRDDEPAASLARDEVLAAAPSVEDGQFRVPRVLGEAP